MAHILLRGTVAALALLPLHLRSALGRAAGFLFSLIPTAERTILRLQLAQCIPESAQRWREVYLSIGQSVMEAIDLRPLLARPDLITCNDQALLRDLASTGRVLCLSAHCSNWELLAGYVAQNGAKLSTVGKEAQSPALQSLLSSIRGSVGVDTIWRADARAAVMILQRLRAGEAVATLLDQDTQVPGIFVPFFGMLAKTPSGMIEIAKRAGARIALYLIARNANSRYEVRVFELDNQASVEAILGQYHKHLEAHIREFPGQWMWVHKRWRSFPDGRRLRTAQYIEFLREKARAQSTGSPGVEVL